MASANYCAAELITVVIADDQTTVREGLSTVLSLLPDVAVVGEASDGAEALDLVASHKPRVVLMDLRMPNLSGADATARIAAEYPATAVLVLTTYADGESIDAALRAGARGYLTKDAGRQEIAAAIRAVAAGQSTFAAPVSDRLVAALTSAPRAGRDASPLSRREQEVLALMAKGLNNTEIAARLFIGVSTVKSHINSLFAKLHVRDRAQAIAYAHRAGLA
ncbi:response regulator transcription factor [Mycobacteroides franklinii]|uniref:response regulator transcription factor n=1 Tax=Mycobacteroides franklinii TaxID=948102 RepID=UPI003013598A